MQRAKPYMVTSYPDGRLVIESVASAEIAQVDETGYASDWGLFSRMQLAHDIECFLNQQPPKSPPVKPDQLVAATTNKEREEQP